VHWTVRTWNQFAHEACRSYDLVLALEHQVLHLGWPFACRERLRPAFLSVREALVRPHVNDLVQWSDRGVPVRAKWTDLHPVDERIAEEPFEFVERAGFQ